MAKIGEILVSQGLLSEAELSRALELQRGAASGTRLGGILLKWDLLDESDLLAALSRVHRCAAADWASLSSAARDVAQLLSPAQAARLGALPYAAENKTVRVAFVDPSNLAAVDEVSAITGRRVIPAVAPEVRMMQAHQRFYARPLSREIWSIVQKLELRRARPQSQRPRGARANDAPPAPLELSEIADSLLPMLDDSWGEAIRVGRVADTRADYGADPEEEVDELPDPLTDESPLSKFVGDVLTYFAARSDLDSALESIAEPEPEEELELAPDTAAEDAPLDPDETLPSGVRRRKRPSQPN